MKIGFLFPGQGAQSVGMGKDLYDKYEEVKEALKVGEYNMIVTPKEIDDLIENMKDIVARGINFAV